MKIIFRCTLVAIILIYSLASSCNNELNTLTDWKETTVIYGLLNPADTTQYIKISKVFLGEGNALVYAREYDSVYYRDELQVTLERWKNGSLLESTALQKDNTLPKNSGIFHAPDHLLYKTNNPVYQDGSTYKITVYNTKSGTLTSAETDVVHAPTPQSPSKIFSMVDLSKATAYNMRWLSAKNGKLYEVKARFYYQEILSFDSTQIQEKYIDWVIGTVKSLHLDSGEVMSQSIVGENFYRLLSNTLAPNPDIYRQAKGFDFTYSIAGEALNTYMEVVHALKSSQSEMIYTNINNGLGLFSSRYNYVLKNIQLSSASVDSLTGGRYTKGLGFK